MRNWVGSNDSAQVYYTHLAVRQYSLTQCGKQSVVCTNCLLTSIVM